MQALPGWKNGIITLNATYSIIRDPVSGLIISICGKGKNKMDYTDISITPNFKNCLLQT